MSTAPAPTVPADTGTQSITPAGQDKALWVTILTPILVAVLTPVFEYLSTHLGVQLPSGAVTAFVGAVVLPAIAFIVGHKVKSAAVLIAEIKADAAKAVGALATTPEAAAASINVALGQAVPK